jgi:hypothetical protein
MALQTNNSEVEVKETEGSLPVAFSTATLLGLGWIRISVTGFGKVAWEPRFTLSSALSNAGVVAVSELVGTSHCPALALTSNR